MSAKIWAYASTASLALTAAALPVAAQQATPVTELQRIVVEGGEVEGSVEAALAARRKAAEAKVVIEGEQLNQFSDLSAGDAIRRLPGVTFPGVNRPREIKLRGIGKEYTQVLIDGRPLIDGDASRNFEVDRIPASMIERIEIIRSPLSNMASLGAAGTVNIITKRQFRQNGGGISVGGGYLTDNGPIGDISGWASGEKGGFRYFLGADYQRRRVNEGSTERNFTGALAPSGGSVQEQNRKFDEYFVTGRFEYDLTENDTFTFSPTYSRSHELREQSEYRFTTNQLSFDRRDDETRNRTRETFAGYFEWKHAFSPETETRVFVDLQKGSEATVRDGVRFSLPALAMSNISQRLAGINLERFAPGIVLNTQFGDHAIEGGAGASFSSRSEFETRYNYNNSGGLTGVVPNNNRTYKVGEDIYYGYLMDRFTVFGPDQLTAGLRIEHSITNTTDVAGNPYRIEATNFNPSLQYKYDVSEDLAFRMGVARTLRRPDLRELTPTLTTNSGTLSSPDTRGNPTLNPEKIWGLDTGLDWYLFGGKGIVSANFFARSFTDKIEQSLNLEAGRWVSDPRNVGDGWLYGAEVEGRVSLDAVGLENLTLSANATLMKSSLIDEATGQRRRFAETPNVVSNIGVDYYVPDWAMTFGLNLNTVYAYSQDIQQVTAVAGVYNTVRTEFSNLNRLDLNVKKDFGNNFSLSFSALNLLRPTDRRVRTTYDSTGAMTGQVRTAEDSYSTYYLRANYKW